MTVAFEIGVCNLLPEFLADALVVFASLQAAGAVAAGAFQTFPNRLNHFLIFIEPYSHGITPFFFHYTTVVKP